METIRWTDVKEKKFRISNRTNVKPVSFHEGTLKGTDRRCMYLERVTKCMVYTRQTSFRGKLDALLIGYSRPSYAAKENSAFF